MSLALRQESPRIGPSPFSVKREPTTHAFRHALVYPLFLAGLAFLVFRDGFQHHFTNWDDPQYIVQNPLIQGLSLGRIREAFTSFQVFNYNPLHIVSYMVDYELWGLHPGGFFFTSLLFHVLGGVALYFFLLRFLRSPESALLLAALFLTHPTRVESVAWLSERKDVLSGFFGALSLFLYWSHLDRRGSRSRAWLWLGSWLTFLLALFSKSQAVTLPIVFFAMDLFKQRPFLRALLEKAPFALLSILFSIITVCAHSGEAAHGLDFPQSVLVPVAALPRYLLHFLVPVGLSPYYDYPKGAFSTAVPLLSGSFLIILAMGTAFRSYRGERVWLLGLAWFFGLLLPVSGIFRINILLADRYLYLAMVGLLVAMAHTLLRASVPRRGCLIFCLSVVSVSCLLTSSYVTVFTDSSTLWSRVLEIFPRSSLAHANLGDYLREQGRIAEAAAHYDADLSEPPYYESSLLGRALLHEELGETEEARRLYQKALEKRPDSATARVQYADFLDWVKEPENGLAILRGLDPRKANGAVYQKMFDLCRELGRPDEALVAAQHAVELAPYDPGSWVRLALAAEAEEKLDLAQAAARRACEMAPGSPVPKEALERILLRIQTKG